jgi:hypothetical protein
VSNTFNVQRHLISRRTLRLLFRAEAMAQWGRGMTSARNSGALRDCPVPVTKLARSPPWFIFEAAMADLAGGQPDVASRNSQSRR